MSRPHIGCDLLKIEYDFDKKLACLHIPDDACVDIKSAISYVETIFPAVRHIRTTTTQPDTEYKKDDAVWVSSLRLLNGATHE